MANFAVRMLCAFLTGAIQESPSYKDSNFPFLESTLSFPAAEPPNPRRVSEGFLEGSLKGF